MKKSSKTVKIGQSIIFWRIYDRISAIKVGTTSKPPFKRLRGDNILKLTCLFIFAVRTNKSAFLWTDKLALTIEKKRRRSDSNRRITVLQTVALVHLATPPGNKPLLSLQLAELFCNRILKRAAALLALTLCHIRLF